MSYMEDRFHWFEVKRQVKKLSPMEKGPALSAWSALRKTERRVDNIAKMIDEFPATETPAGNQQPYDVGQNMEQYWREEHAREDQRRRNQMDKLHRFLYPENYSFWE